MKPVIGLCLALSMFAYLAGCVGPNVADSGGSTPLMWAAQNGDLQKASALIAQGADVNARNGNGVSVLYHTTYYKRAEAALYLMERGARPASENERIFIEAMLVETGVKPPAPAPKISTSEAVAGRSLPVLEPSFPPSERPDDFAVIIGVENYADLPPASYAGRDASAVRRFVAAMGVPERNIMALTDGRATRTGIEKLIEAWLPNNVTADSRVYVYYSGHGAPDAKTGDAYLVPSDGDPRYLEQTGYPLKRLYARLGQLKARSVLVALDSCFSGAGGRSVLAKGMRPLVAKVDVAAGEGKVSVISASAADQVSGSNDEAGYGLFTYALLQGLNGGAKDQEGKVTLKSLYAYLKPRVQDEARRGNGDQTPQLQSAGEDIVLRAK